jgi:RNA-directed DNA polymerase
MSSSQNQMKTTEIKTIKHLEAVLKVKIEDIQKIIEHTPQYYYEKKELKYDKQGNVKMKNGQPQYRIIYPSTGDLKKLQSVIHQKILSKIPLPSNVKGGVKGNDNISNAKIHQGNKYKFVTDLQDFYPSVSFEAVVSMFIKNGFSKKIAIILSQLTTFRNHVPQGGPASGSIANLFFVPIDISLLKICEEHQLKYSR